MSPSLILNSCAQRGRVVDCLVAAEGDFFQPVSLAFFDRHGDIHHLAVTVLKGKYQLMPLVSRIWVLGSSTSALKYPLFW